MDVIVFNHLFDKLINYQTVAKQNTKFRMFTCK